MATHAGRRLHEGASDGEAGEQAGNQSDLEEVHDRMK